MSPVKYTYKNERNHLQMIFVTVAYIYNKELFQLKNKREMKCKVDQGFEQNLPKQDMLPLQLATNMCIQKHSISTVISKMQPKT